MAVYFNVTTSWHWRRPPVGIVRVERQLLAHLVRSSTPTHCCVLDRDEGAFRHLLAEEVERLLDESWCMPTAASPAPAAPPRGRVHFVGKRLLGKLLPPIFQDLVRIARRHLTPTPRPPSRSPAGRPIAPSPKDRFLSIGLDWDYGLESIATLHRRTGVPIVLGCYDTISVDYPELASRSSRDFFQTYFVRLGQIAERIFAISETTRRDLEGLYARLGVVDPPPIVTIPLGCNEPRMVDPSRENHDIPNNKEGFVLYVSTIEARKNHRVLVQVWSDLCRRYGEHVPTLVLVGRSGWGVRDLLEELHRMDVARNGLVQVIHDASDDLLALLYQRCLFAVFPSIYEGWGLSAVEAMSYGKMCVVSDAPALVEATQGLCPAIHPFDFLGWRDAVVRYWKSPGDREAVEFTIRSSFRMRTWREFGLDFEAFLAGFESRSDGPKNLA